MELNLFQKINELRERILKLDLKKSGENKFANYSYYELADFLPQVIQLEKEIGLTSMFSTYNNKGTLIVVDIENGQQVEFSVVIKEANAKGMLEIQKAGAEITYGKRYAYLNYLNLTESDGVDGLNQKTAKDDNVWQSDKDRVNAILAISELLGDDQSKLAQWFKSYDINHDTITPKIADEITNRIKALQSKAKTNV